MCAQKKNPPQQEEIQPEFVFPEIHTMMAVEVTTTLDWSEFSAGMVLRPKNRGADIVMMHGGFAGGMAQLRDCLHESDPWIQERPAMFEEGDRGIFRLAKSEKQMRMILDQFVQTNAAIEELVARVAKLEQDAKK